MINKTLPPPVFFIQSLLKQNHSVAIYSKFLPKSLSADVVELNTLRSVLVLDVYSSDDELSLYVNNGYLNLDFEIIKGTPPIEREGYCLSNIPASLIKDDTNICRLECRLPESFLTHDRRGAVRIPFILGMSCRARIEIFTHFLNITAKVKNLSIGGCLLELQLKDSEAIDINKKVQGIYLSFPNGETFSSEGVIRHIRSFGSYGYAVAGVQFINLLPKQFDTLFHMVTESERELVFLSGMSGHEITKSPLFIPGSIEKSFLLNETLERDKRAHQTPMEKGILNIANQLQIGLMYIKTQNYFSAEIFYDCVDALLSLIRNDRKEFFYSLSFIRDEPNWVRHSINVASRLADIILIHNPHTSELKETLLGILLHNLGKPLLISEKLPSLNSNFTFEQKNILKEHVKVILAKFKELGWEPSAVCRRIIEDANERIDGTGYPSGKKLPEMTPVIRLISVLKAIDKLSFRRNGSPANTPLEVYRIINQEQSSYEKKWLVYYIQLYGTYPIGCLVKYSGGFLAWVTDIDKTGHPIEVRVIKDLRYPDANINSLISGFDLTQIGKLENVVDPLDYDIRVKKL
ncbi:PilZ domain-containing protein [Enterobacter roggenkampii]|nr:PilZ domain-containing protein [Enterobacter roggenkampii]